MKRTAAIATQLINDEQVCVTRFDFVPGAETGWHEHRHDYVITTLTDCSMQLEEPGGETRKVLVEAGTVYKREKGVKHNVINGGTAAMSFVEVELK